MSAYNKNPETFVLTSGHDGQQSSYTFAPGAIIILKYSNIDKHYLQSFRIGNKIYYFKSAHVHNNIAAEAIKNNALSISSRIGAAGGPTGILIGIIAGLTIQQIASHFPAHIHDSGYYCDGKLMFEGPIRWEK